MVRGLIVTFVLCVSCTSAIADGSFAPRRPIHDVGNGLSIVAKDFWAFATSPSRLSRDEIPTVLGVLAVGGVLFALDPEIQDTFERNVDAPVFEQTRSVGEEFGKWGLQGPTTRFYVGAIVAGYAVDQPWLLRIGAEIIEAQYMCGLVRGVAVTTIGRHRPRQGRGAYHFAFRGGASTPSGHATNIWSAAEVLRQHVDQWWATAALYTIAGSVSLQRIHSGAHWASDVWLGSVLGITAARFAYGRHESGDDRVARVLPVIGPDGNPGIGFVRGF